MRRTVVGRTVLLLALMVASVFLVSTAASERPTNAQTSTSNEWADIKSVSVTYSYSAEQRYREQDSFSGLIVNDDRKSQGTAELKLVTSGDGTRYYKGTGNRSGEIHYSADDLEGNGSWVETCTNEGSGTETNADFIRLEVAPSSGRYWFSIWPDLNVPTTFRCWDIYGNERTEQRTTPIIVNDDPNQDRPLPGGTTIDGSVTETIPDLSLTESLTWNFVGKKATSPLKVSSDRARACTNQRVTFAARNSKNNLVNARWSGGGVPDTGRGERFTTRFRNHGERTVTARTTSGASGTKTITVLENSGLVWAPRFPTSRATADLSEPFRSNVDNFLAALRGAGLVDATGQANPPPDSYNIIATRRPAERAWLMHYSWRIANRGFDPADVPHREGIDICWVHRNRDGTVDRRGSVQAARQMVGPNGYGISPRLRVPPTINSNHIPGEAIDMDIRWTGTLNIATPDGTIVPITSTPRTGAGNVDLWDFASEHYHVHKLRVGDPPHWSVDGH